MNSIIRASTTALAVSLGLSACVDATSEKTQSSNTMTKTLRQMARSGPSSNSAFLRPAKLTIIEDKISLLNSDLDRTEVHEYYPAACESPSGHCLYYLGSDGKPILSSPAYDFPYTIDSSGISVFQYNKCQDWRGNATICDPGVSFVQLYANGLGMGSDSMTEVSMFTWYQDSAQARRAANLRASVTPQLLGDRVTSEEIRQNNEAVIGVAGAVLTGVIEVAAAANGVPGAGSTTAGTRDGRGAGSSSNATAQVRSASMRSDDAQDVTAETRKDLGTFVVNKREIRICVWDQQCEDGDRVAVEIRQRRDLTGPVVTMRPITNRKLENTPYCFDWSIPEHSSSLDIRLKAINGTGFEGQCNHADANTGAMSVSGGGGRDTWRLSGGSGTSTSIRYQP